MDLDSSVSMAIRYGLDNPEIESLWAEIIFTRPDRPCVCVYRVPLPEVKRQGHDVDRPPHLAPRLKKGVEQ